MFSILPLVCFIRLCVIFICLTKRASKIETLLREKHLSNIMIDLSFHFVRKIFQFLPFHIENRIYMSRFLISLLNQDFGIIFVKYFEFYISNLIYHQYRKRREVKQKDLKSSVMRNNFKVKIVSKSPLNLARSVR